MEFDDSLLVDFSDIPDPIQFQETNIPEEKKESNEYNYDKETTDRYKVMRLRKMDPLTYDIIDDNYAFKFKCKWDPYTGERLEEDPYGPLYFDPDILIHYFYFKRLDKLWVHPKDEMNSGYYQGYYDDGVGAGDEFYVSGRGSHPEWYIFRIPINDCYLPKDHNRQFITFGPKLTDDEIIEIDRLANLRENNYRMLFGRKRPSLRRMKELYDLAITKEPNKNKYIEDPNIKDIQQEYNKINRNAVDLLVAMSG